ncbi:MAG: hypothetical protein KC420_05435, partial [Myxococcales bacterium]|nr:hypothetical protein [Myxococcales bacterium]
MSSGSSERDGEVLCLGLRFADEAARRAHFRARLRERLSADGAALEAEGAPLGGLDAIVALSDPPHYTACPNPFIAEARELFNERPPPAVGPLVADVREGKGDPVYNAHSYHTKVPHRAIMRFLLHYTEPGAVVLDPFAGTGMTGVAAAFCGHADAALRAQIEGERAAAGLGPPRWGERRAILADLSSVAAFVAHRFCSPSEPPRFEAAARRILAEVEAELGWMYETRHDDGRVGRIHYVLWSDVFLCPECGGELVFWEVAVDRQAGRVRRRFRCPVCGAGLARAGLRRAFEEVDELDLGGRWRRARRSPVLIRYAVPGIAGRLEKRPDADDLARIDQIDRLRGGAWFPRDRLPPGEETRRNDDAGLTHVHHFYTRRNLLALAALRARIWPAMDEAPALGMWFTSAHAWGTRLNRLLLSNYFQRRGGVIGQTLQGTLYVSSLSVETNVLERFRLRIASVPHTAPRRT